MGLLMSNKHFFEYNILPVLGQSSIEKLNCPSRVSGNVYVILFTLIDRFLQYPKQKKFLTQK